MLLAAEKTNCYPTWGKIKTKQDNSAKIQSLIADTNALESADELLVTYDGREEELLMHLRKMKTKQDKKEKIAYLVGRFSVAKSAEELLAAYDNRKDELMKNLQKMEAPLDLFRPNPSFPTPQTFHVISVIW